MPFLSLYIRRPVTLEPLLVDSPSNFPKSAVRKEQNYVDYIEI